jgi:hypothetical protein
MNTVKELFYEVRGVGLRGACRRVALYTWELRQDDLYQRVGVE